MMDRITLGRVQCVRFLLKAVYDILGEIKIHNGLDFYLEKRTYSELIAAHCSIACAIQTLEKALEHAAEPDAD